MTSAEIVVSDRSPDGTSIIRVQKMAPKRKAAQVKTAAEEPPERPKRGRTSEQDSEKKTQARKASPARKAAKQQRKAKEVKSKPTAKPDFQRTTSKGATSKSRTVHSSEQVQASGNRVSPVTNWSDVPEGLSRDKRGRLVFKDHPEFRPTLTPKQMIQAGSFGGVYFNPKGGRKGILFPKGVPISSNDFPQHTPFKEHTCLQDWFEGLRPEQYKGSRYNIQLNRYKVKSGQNQQQWEEQGWIKKDSIDKRGWFQWYCHFTLGRRTDDDKRQISRWTGVAGPKGRWKTRLFNLVKNAGGDIGDGSISPVIRQNLLHWAYELTPEDYEAMLKGKRY